MLDQAYDAIAVDARVAGSTAAALWGDAGYRTLPVDRAAFPGPTLSTRFFRGGGLGAVLNRLGVLDQVLALGYPPLSANISTRTETLNRRKDLPRIRAIEEATRYTMFNSWARATASARLWTPSLL